MKPSFKEYLHEAPLFHDEELPVKSTLKHELNNKTYDNLKSTHKFFGRVMSLQIWFNGSTFIVGHPYKQDNQILFSIGMIIQTRGTKSFPTAPRGLIFGENSYQVSWAEVSKDFENVGLAKQVYLKIIGKRGSLVSDNEQYLGAKRLWLTLSRSVSVFVWDGNINDYVRDASGDLMRVENIDHKKIWNTNVDARNILLVAVSDKTQLTHKENK